MITSRSRSRLQTLTVASATALLLLAGTTQAQLSGGTGSTTGSSCTGNNADGFCGFGRSTLVSNSTTFQSRYEWNINADVGIFSTRDTSGTAQHNVSVNATAVGGYRLDIATSRVGDMNRISDASGCDGAADVSGVTGSSNIALSSGSISLADPGSIGNGGGDADSPFSQSSSATIFRVSNGVAQAHSFTFTWSGSVRSNSCEAAVRVGAQNGTTTGCNACGYAGTPARTQSSDGHFVTLTFTSLCGNGALDAAAGEQCDLGGANGSATSCCTSQCQFRAAGQVCRVGGGAPCDLNETCTGASGSCPADDAPGNAGNTCRTGSGDSCDPDEVCNGVAGVACPADVVTSNGTQCRAGSGDVCDPAEACTGVPGQPCPGNVVNGPSTTCRIGSGDACDTNETCTGLAGAPCPPDDAPINAGTVCRSGSGDSCDANEACTGTPGQPCPPDDAPGNAGVICRPSSAGGSFCDLDEACSGTPGATCPPNDAPLKVNVVCRTGSGDLCDPDERCTGIIGQGCPADVVAPPTTVCRAGSGDICDPSEFCPAVAGQPCPANSVAANGTVCRAAAGVCDVAEACSGTPGASCPSNGFVNAGASCNEDGDLCTVDQCDGSGNCAPTGPLPCDDGNTCTQDTCDPDNGCVYTGAPATTCSAPLKAKFQVKDNTTTDAADSLKFQWKGGPVLITDLADPTQTTRYELCIYDSTGPRLALDVNPGAGWTASGQVSSPSGYKYKDNLLTQDGIKKILLKASSITKGKLDLGAKGVNTPDTALPFLLPVTAQLYNSTTGKCWEASFTTLQTQRNDAGQYKGKR